MPSSRFLFLTILTCALFASLCSAADLPPGLSEEDIPSGVLLSPGPELSGLHLHNGSNNGPRLTLGLWRQMLFEINQASITNRAWPSPRNLEQQARSTQPTHVIPVSILDVMYERLPEQSRPGDTISSHELEHGRVFAAAPLRSTTYHGDHIVFTFDPAWMIGRLHQAIEMNTGNGQGWQPVQNGRFETQASTTGDMSVQLRVKADDGTDLTTRFTLQVAALITPAPHDTLQIQATVDYLGAFSSGSAYVYLSDQHTALTNPVIVVEGFDLDDTMGWDELYELLNQEQLIETLRSEGFDAVVLDFDSATDPIQGNAFVVTELLSQIRTMVPEYQTSVLIGASMGGLVSRFALGWLQDQGIDPGVRTWISFDSPQRGASIPLGLQHWLEFFRDEAESAAFLLSRLDTPAARQMLLLHHDTTSGTTAGPDVLRTLFTQHLASVSLPACRRVSIANGSGVMADQGFAPEQQIIRYEYYSLLLDLKGNVWSVPDGTSARIFQGEQNLIWPLPDVYEDVHVTGTLPWDNAPGGWRASMAQMDTTSVPYGDIEALHEHHCFVPTISALDLDVIDPFFDVLGDPDLLSKTSFDLVYVPATNQEHVSITPESVTWFLDEIRYDVSAVDETPQVAVSSMQAWPNPFNPQTTISFEIREAGPVHLSIHDLRGRLVAVVLDKSLDPGHHSIRWAGRSNPTKVLASGTYIVTIQRPSGISNLPITLLE